MRPAYCLLALFAALTCVFGTERPQNCPRITDTSFNGKKTSMDRFCQDIDKENSDSESSSWKFITVLCPKKTACCARLGNNGEISYFNKTLPKSKAFCKKQG
uniref:Putative secreted protein n=1 Tax=Amblyomma americanum TaxID=6943 RepID=A0A0C9SEM5_AMBAM